MALSNKCSHHTISDDKAGLDRKTGAGLAIQRWGGLARSLFEATWGVDLKSHVANKDE
jgi:hypothetical protein